MTYCLRAAVAISGEMLSTPAKISRIVEILAT